MKRIVLLGLALLFVLAVTGCSDPLQECRDAGGRVLTHFLTGNDWCDLPPYVPADGGITDLGGRDYLIRH